MKEILNNDEGSMQELNDSELENIRGGFAAGDVVVYKEWTMCPGCLGSIPRATLQFYRGLDPNSEKAWIVKTHCCGAIFTCVESGVRRV